MMGPFWGFGTDVKLRDVSNFRFHSAFHLVGEIPVMEILSPSLS